MNLIIFHLVFCYIAMEAITIFKFGKPSISMDHGLTMANCNSHNQRVYLVELVDPGMGEQR